MNSKKLKKLVSYAKRVNNCDDEYNCAFNAEHNYGDVSNSELMGKLARGVIELYAQNQDLKKKYKEVNNASS